MGSVIIDGRNIADQIITALAEQRSATTRPLRLGVLMSAGDAATESFIRIKSRAAQRLGVEVVREELDGQAGTEDALSGLKRLCESTDGIIVQLPLPKEVDGEAVLQALPSTHDVDAIGQGPYRVLAPVAAAVKEILEREQIQVENKKAIVVGAGRLVGKPSADLLREMGADVSVITTEQGSIADLQYADIVVSGAGDPGVIKPEMLKKGVILIDAGTSEAGGKVSGDADPACADVASVFTPVPGGVGPIAIAMIFKNLYELTSSKFSPSS